MDEFRDEYYYPIRRHSMQNTTSEKIFYLINWPRVTYHDNIFIFFCDINEFIIIGVSFIPVSPYYYYQFR